MKRYIPLALVLLGGLLVSKSVYYYGKGALANVLLTRAWEKSKETKSHHNPWSWADMHPVGRIEIESVGLSSVVLNTISGEALAFGPGHLSSTPKPGRPGNIVLAGHRDGHFRKLKNVQEGFVGLYMMAPNDGPSLLSIQPFPMGYSPNISW